MMQPTIAAPIAPTRTAPAAQSLAFFASGWMRMFRLLFTVAAMPKIAHMKDRIIFTSRLRT